MFKFLHIHSSLQVPCRHKGSFVAHVSNISSCKTRSKRCKPLCVIFHLLFQLKLFQVDHEDLLTALYVWVVDSYLPIETAGSQQCFVKDIWSVRTSKHNDTSCGGKTIHFNEELIQGIFSLVIASDATSTSATGATNGVYFIYEDDRRTLLTGLREEVAYTSWAYADIHFHEIGATNGQERDFCLSSCCLGQESLTSSRWTYEQSSLGNRRPKLLVLIRVLEEMHKLHNFNLRLITSSDVFE
mmetsp:Transcript_20337/g.24378  ORF Transcript_20337/g.24378 Transcript_20337/m.24378 type:complete len:242 (+) Transcript_20337:1186-1911(+)